jgi:heme/copper-type cytochrome/quinol oxidase subunit 2
MRTRQWVLVGSMSACVFYLVTLAAQEPGGQVREFNVIGEHYTFTPDVLAVAKDDLVKVTFTAKDLAYSFAIDGPYRISKRAGAGKSVTFQFLADTPGEFQIYCNLSSDPKCKP